MGEGRAIGRHSTRLTWEEWRAIVQWFRAYEAELRASYGEPHDKEGTFRAHYKNADPTGYMLYEAARTVIGEDPN